MPLQLSPSSPPTSRECQTSLKSVPHSVPLDWAGDCAEWNSESRFLKVSYQNQDFLRYPIRIKVSYKHTNSGHLSNRDTSSVPPLQSITKYIRSYICYENTMGNMDT